MNLLPDEIIHKIQKYYIYTLKKRGLQLIDIFDHSGFFSTYQMNCIVRERFLYYRRSLIEIINDIEFDIIRNLWKILKLTKAFRLWLMMLHAYYIMNESCIRVDQKYIRSMTDANLFTNEQHKAVFMMKKLLRDFIQLMQSEKTDALPDKKKLITMESKDVIKKIDKMYTV